MRMIAARGVAQKAKPGTSTACAAAQIAAPEHPLIENSLKSIEEAFRRHAEMVVLNVRLTRDQRLAVFADATLDCRTNGAGAVRDKTLAQLKALDLGYRYSADGGKSFPLRGKGQGKLVALDEVIAALPARSFMISLDDDTPAAARALTAAFARAGRAMGPRYGVSGSAATLAALGDVAPGVWLWNRAAAQRCGHEYQLYGWSGVMPASCIGGTINIALDTQWKTWGWPNRFLERMAANKVQVVLTAPGTALAGLDQLEQIPRVPKAYTGFLWVDDIFNIGPAIRVD